ncbi:MAG: acylneuraminate cytidylyltransferase family protein [Chthoniobacterales bacterium]
MNSNPPTCLAYIPAKATSVRLPRKNILPLGDKPVLAWSIEAARDSGIMDRIIVSTESEEIAEVARAYGAEVPFLRPPNLSLPQVPNHEVLLHLLAELKTRDGYVPDMVMTLQPTSPLRSSEDIRAAHALALTHFPKPVISLNKEIFIPTHVCEVDDQGNIVQAQIASPHRALHKMNGAIFIASTEKILTAINPYENAISFLMPAHRSLDVDTADDLEMTRAIAKHFNL